jgi:hypothetical protein
MTRPRERGTHTYFGTQFCVPDCHAFCGMGSPAARAGGRSKFSATLPEILKCFLS